MNLINIFFCSILQFHYTTLNFRNCHCFLINRGGNILLLSCLFFYQWAVRMNQKIFSLLLISINHYFVLQCKTVQSAIKINLTWEKETVCLEITTICTTSFRDEGLVGRLLQIANTYISLLLQQSWNDRHMASIFCQQKQK